MQWLKTCSQLIPMDVRQRCTNGYFLNVNSLTQRYLRRVYNISAGLCCLSSPQPSDDTRWFYCRDDPLQQHQGMLFSHRTSATCASIMLACLRVSKYVPVINAGFVVTACSVPGTRKQSGFHRGHNETSSRHTYASWLGGCAHAHPYNFGP